MKRYLLLLLIPLVFIQCAHVSYKPINPTDGAYSEGFEIKNFKRLVFISGQIPMDEKENVPDDFKSQCELVWKNIEKQLKDADMTIKNIVKFTCYLSDRKYRGESYEVRQKVLGDHKPAMTIIIAGIYNEKWLLEIEVIAGSR